MLMEDIKARLEDKTNYPYEEGFNPYQLWMDAKALLNEMEYWKNRAKNENLCAVCASNLEEMPPTEAIESNIRALQEPVEMPYIGE